MHNIVRRSLFIVCVVTLSRSAVLNADGKPAGKKSLGGSGQMVQLELSPENRTLTGIEVHGSRYGTANPPNEKFLIYILSADQSEIIATRMAPYSLFERGDEKWVSIPFDKPIEAPADGWIVVDFRAGRTKGVYVSYDAEGSGERSRTGLPGMEAKKPDFVGGWMIRPIVKN
ncbi:MAG: hypothetical protein ACKV0T_18965 [Planctomycetales bacterium]